MANPWRIAQLTFVPSLITTVPESPEVMTHTHTHTTHTHSYTCTYVHTYINLTNDWGLSHYHGLQCSIWNVHGGGVEVTVGTDTQTCLVVQVYSPHNLTCRSNGLYVCMYVCMYVCIGIATDTQTWFIPQINVRACVSYRTSGPICTKVNIPQRFHSSGCTMQCITICL